MIVLEDRYSKDNRDKILRELKKRGIGCGNYFQPIHLQPFYVEAFGFKKGDFPITEYVSERTIALPFYSKLTEPEIDSVIGNLKKIVAGL